MRWAHPSARQRHYSTSAGDTSGNARRPALPRFSFPLPPKAGAVARPGAAIIAATVKNTALNNQKKPLAYLHPQGASGKQRRNFRPRPQRCRRHGEAAGPAGGAQMGGCWFLLCAVLLHRAACSGHGAATEVNGAVGKSVTFRLQSPPGTHVAWMVQNDLIATVKLGNPPSIVFFDEKRGSHLSFPDNGTAVTISRLAMGDAGTYMAQISDSTKFLFNLHVYPELPPPAVTCVSHNCSAAACRYVLRCAAPAPAANVSYRWSTGGEPPLTVTAPLLELPPGPELPVTCTARNPVSSSNVTVEPAAACAEISPGSRTVIIVVAVISAVLFSALGIGWIFCSAKARRIFTPPAGDAAAAGAEPECVTVYARVGHLWQDHAQNFPSAEKTDAKTTPAADGETSKTIYSTVQATAQLQTDDEKICNGVPEQGVKSLYATASTVTAPGSSMGLL
ncbi:SLAM family member 5-like isoform X2 [Dromaius novaehollandiae]|uniref:SLAM family member 5-like isoform X2 n=1 Tax=Dromaius novaehollandiae TaxID=8790 RepID=UPI00311E048C